MIIDLLYYKNEEKTILLIERKVERLNYKIVPKVWFEVKEYITKKWEGKYSKQELKRKYFDFAFLKCLYYYFLNGSLFEMFDYFDIDVENISFEKIKEALNISIEEIEQNIRNLEDFKEKIEFYETKPEIVYSKVSDLKYLTKKDFKKAYSIWEYYVKRRFVYNDDWLKAREYLNNKWNKKHSFKDLLQKNKEYAVLNDIAGILDFVLFDGFSEYKNLINEDDDFNSYEGIIKVLDRIGE